MKTLRNTLLLSLALMGFLAFNMPDQSGEWVVPDKYKNMENPTDADDEENLEIGEELYMKHCRSCHGKEGYGDGPKAADQNGDLGDFSSEEFQAQSDGALYYKTTFGRDDMPAYEKKVPSEEDRWLIVNYMRYLGE